MKYDKRIITHKWGNNSTADEYTSSNGFVISGDSYDRSIAALNEMVAEAKRDFPSLSDSEIQPFIITRSTYNKCFAGIRFPLPANATKDGYKQGSELDFAHS